MRASDAVEVEGPANALTISSEDVELAHVELANEIDKRAERVVEHALEKMAPNIVESLYAALPQQLKEQRAVQEGFEERLYQRWKGGLDRLEMLIIMAHESGETYLADLQREFVGQSQSDESVLLDVLVSLHCRACRTAREILSLLRAGYADGANARWRSLHELAVTALFLAQHRGDAPERYRAHAAVQRWRAATPYQEHCHTLGYEPFSPEEMAEMKEAADNATAKYGVELKKNYGWAAEAICKPQPNFAEIEASLDLSAWRPFFGLASQGVHADARALFFSLGLPEDAETRLLAGASDAGLADPGHCTAISLTLTSVALLTAKPNLDALIACKCMLSVCEDVGTEFLRSHQIQRSHPSSPSTAWASLATRVKRAALITLTHAQSSGGRALKTV
ncbi:MAG TPA: DUF5677 domain-containing protein, partial [Planctomycetaceae bacterium]|nr:DUF5677 domain-containing protein [Planctomycetaceae bacterium]